VVDTNIWERRVVDLPDRNVALELHTTGGQPDVLLIPPAHRGGGDFAQLAVDFEHHHVSPNRRAPQVGTHARLTRGFAVGLTRIELVTSSFYQRELTGSPGVALCSLMSRSTS
jgi:hypothetical protein